MNYVSLALFLISSSVQLYGSYINDNRLRYCSKPLIVLSLIGWYCFYGFEGPGSYSLEVTMILALLFSWFGDILLMFKGNGWFAAGGVTFGISHLLFSATYLKNIPTDRINYGIFAAVAIIYAVIVIIVFKGLFRYLPKALIVPMFVYLLVNGMMNCFAFMQLYTVPCAGSIITFVGAMLFFASDSILFYVRFKPDSVWKMHFLVMLTYILAEFLIVQGIMMIP